MLIGDIKKYYENTEDVLPYLIVQKFIGMNIKPKNAIDLGCGVGRDTVFKKNGYFVGNFLGLNDLWAKIKDKMIFLSEEQVLDLFKNSFEVIQFNESEKVGKTGLGKMKHWNIYNDIKQKK